MAEEKKTAPFSESVRKAYDDALEARLVASLARRENVDAEYPLPRHPLECATCRSRSNPLKKCGRCRVYMYCGSLCQRLDWDTHRVLCGSPLPTTPSATEPSPPPETTPTPPTSAAASSLPRPGQAMSERISKLSAEFKQLTHDQLAIMNSRPRGNLMLVGACASTAHLFPDITKPLVELANAWRLYADVELSTLGMTFD